MVHCLIRLFCENDRITAAVLDTLLHLQMNVQTSTEVVTKMLNALATKPIEDLPVIVRFIVQTSGNIASMEQRHMASSMFGVSSASGKPAAPVSASSTAAANETGRSSSQRKGIDDRMGETFVKLRTALNASSLVNFSEDASASAAASTSRSSTHPVSSAPSLTIESLRQAIRFHPNIGAVWLNTLRKLNTPDQHTKIDVWMMIILFGFQNLSDAVVKAMQKKIAKFVFQYTAHTRGLG